MNTITRRTALAVPVTLPLLPVSAFATPADPLLAAYAEWQVMRGEYEAVVKEWAAVISPNESLGEAVDRETDRILDLENEIADMVPVTVEGMAAQLRVMAYSGGHLDGAMDHAVESRFVRSLLAAAERIAGVAYDGTQILPDRRVIGAGGWRPVIRRRRECSGI